MRLKFNRDEHQSRESKMRESKISKLSFVLYVAAAACIILAVPAADWFASIVGHWMGVGD